VPSEKRTRKRQNAQARAAAERAAQQRARQRRRLFRLAPFAIVIAVVLAILIHGSSGKGKKASSTGSTTSTTASGGPPRAAAVPAGAKITGATPCPAADGSSPRTTTFAKAPPMCIDPAKSYSAVFDTTEGKITVALDTKRTPATVNNFVVLARYHYYDKTSFDRIDTSIDIIQGGSPNTQSIDDPGPGYTIADEGGKFTYQPGDLVMARSSGPNSGAAQYFFVVGPKASALNDQGTYVTFGHVTSGMDVLTRVEGLYQACPSSDQTCLGGAPSRVVLVNTVTITQS
jgi:cyclophilin family peptidyl-prolyl cis-trans isomerase